MKNVAQVMADGRPSLCQNVPFTVLDVPFTLLLTAFPHLVPCCI